MTDIVERLRTEEPSYVLLGDAAIEIGRLRDKVQILDVLVMLLRGNSERKKGKADGTISKEWQQEASSMAG